jgi:hypothetical protein
MADTSDVDRSALAATKVYGIMEDLNMNNAQFATAISILFVGYIPFQLPSNMILTRISRPGLCKSCNSPPSRSDRGWF